MVLRKLDDDAKHMDCSRIFAYRVDCIPYAFEYGYMSPRSRKSICVHVACEDVLSDLYVATNFVRRSQIARPLLRGTSA